MPVQSEPPERTVRDKRPFRVAVLDPIGRGSLQHYALKLTEALVALGVETTLCALLRDDAARRRMGSYARRMADEVQYSWRQTAKDTLAVYERILSGDGTH